MNIYSDNYASDMRHNVQKRKKEAKKARRFILWVLCAVMIMTVGFHIVARAIGGDVWKHYRSENMNYDWSGMLEVCK